jgi:hypothetical protein
MAVKQLPKISDLPEPPDRLVGDQERFDVLTFNSLKAQKKMVNEDLNKTLIPALNQFAVDVNASVDAAALSERNAHDSEEVAKRKAGEASGSAGAAKVSEDNAKVSETNALASKNAAALSAESAESARIAAEAARDEAQDLANVGYVSEGHAGLAKVDGKTTQADAGGVITVKDVAIGGNLEDLASARGYLVDEYLPEFPSRTVLSSFDDATTPGNFHVLWNDTTTSAPDGILNKNQYADGVLEVRDNRSASFVSSFARLMQRLTIIGGATRADSARIFVRTQSWGVTREWFPWVELVSYNKFGDGFRNTNGIISVPEYDGATASTSGTSGLVPPATAGQQESFLTGGGEYKPALTKISDSVSLEDSTTAASAKAVKTAYDLASAALPKSGGTISGNISVVGGITVAAPDGKSEGGQILLKNGTDGSYPVVIDTTQNQIRFLSGPGGPGGFVSVDLETVRFVGNLTGKADSAHLADNTYSLAGRPWLEDLYTDSPDWVIGSVDEQLRPINTGSLKVLAADRIISGSFAYGRASDGFYLPNGGSWFVFCILDNDVSHGSANAIPIMAAGGSHITWSFNGTGYTWIGIKVL